MTKNNACVRRRGLRALLWSYALGLCNVLYAQQFTGNSAVQAASQTGWVVTPDAQWLFSKTPAKVTRGAPLAGEHTRELLQGIGYPEAQIADLLARGILRETRL